MKVLFIIMSIMAFSLSANDGAKENPDSKYIAAVINLHGVIEVLINPRSFWNEEKRLIDSYTEEQMLEVEEITTKVKLCNLMESIYEPCDSKQTIEMVKESLTRIGVSIDKEFQEWAEKE